MLDFPETTLGEGLKVIYHWYCYELLLKAEYKLEGRRIKHGKWMNHMNETLIFRHELHATCSRKHCPQGLGITENSQETDSFLDLHS